ncbi:MAG: DinB family protein [SAR202 cluster bacterium]|nr:DinB family protein [SAR202 cluster bacterium]
MDFKDIIRLGFQEFLEELKEALDGLTPEERRFQPDPESHHIDFAVWHVARVEDDWLMRFAQHAETVWQRDKWHEQFGMPERDSGFGYTAEQVRDLAEFDMDRMLAYYDAVRVETIRFLDSITADTLAETPHAERRPGYTIANMFSHVMVEEAQHVGQVAYLRGIQRGIGK